MCPREPAGLDRLGPTFIRTAFLNQAGVCAAPLTPNGLLLAVLEASHCESVKKGWGRSRESIFDAR